MHSNVSGDYPKTPPQAIKLKKSLIISEICSSIPMHMNISKFVYA